MYISDVHRRRSIRFKGFDYTAAGMYFVTLCAEQRLHLFGTILDEQMRLNDAGQMIERSWSQIPNSYPGFELDAFQIMPNHFHGIIIIVGAGPRACPDLHSLPAPDARAKTPAPALGDMIGRFKTLTAKRYVDGVKQSNWRPFRKRLWQRNYYEHIIRNEVELNHIREYIAQNPILWPKDDYFAT